MFRLKYAARAALLLAVAACTGDVTAPTVSGDAGPAQTISDAAHSGAVPGFYFLPPMVPAPSYSGTFDGALQPTVVICELSGSTCVTTIASYTATVNLASQFYQANWNTSQFNLDPAKTYRISVYVGTFRLGFADVDVVATGKELKNVDTQQYIPLQDDRTLPIKFRIETGIAAQVIVTPDSASIPIGGTQQFTATVLDLHGNPLATSVAWSSSDTLVATVDGSGLATGVAIGQATITATAQAASGSATLTVFNPNTPPVANPDAFDAIGNVTVPVAAPGVLANDTDVDSNPLSVVAGTFPTAAGGTVTLNADGSFSYLSAAGFTGEDSFTYTVTDGIDSASATVTVVSAYRVWYVDNSAAAPGDGRDASPFATLKAAETASAAGETIFLLYGNGTTSGYDDGIVLKTGQSLTGQGVPANVTATLNGQTVVLLAAGNAPTVTRASGATVAISTNNVIQGFDVESSAGAGIAGTGFGTLTVGSMSVAANGGPALDLSSGDVFGAYDALSSTTAAGAGIHLLGVGGSFSAASGTIVVSGAATAGVDVTGGAGVFTYGGDVVATGPLAVFVANRTGGALTFGGTIASTGNGIGVQNNAGGTIAFTGASKTLSAGANAGVRLLNNTGATVSFGGGGLAIATTTGAGFEATGGGTVTVTGAGNSIVSAGGTALHVENTTIGGAGLSFRSVSASGGANGIVLVNTGALNGLQVTGTGVAGSGGSIQGTSGPGVSLNTVRNVSLSYMNVANGGATGIAGTDVTGFALASSTVSGNGNAPGEAGVAFTSLFGTASVTGATITGSAEDNLRVQNSAGTLALSVTGTTVSNTGASGNDGIRVEALGSAVVGVAVSGSTFSANRGDHFQAVAGGSADLDVGFTGNVLSGGHASALGQGVTISALSAFVGTVDYDISGNSIAGAVTTAVSVDLGLSAAGAVFAGQLRNNQIGSAGVALSCSAQGSGISVDARGHGTHTAAITGNNIRRCLDRGISAGASDGDGTLNLTVTGNTVAELVNASSREGFFLNAGAFSPNAFGATDSHTVCLELGGAGGLANSLTHGPSATADYRLRQRFATTVRLPGYAGANNDTGAVIAFVSARNGGASGNVQATVPPGGGYVGGAACPQP
jgi:hypothetical protein